MEVYFNTKADIYTEMVVDGNPSRKTHHTKNFDAFLE
jgi:hypothetical protein